MTSHGRHVIRIGRYDRSRRAASPFALLACVLGFATTIDADAGDLPPPRGIAAHSYAWIGPYGPPTRENAGFRMNLGFVAGDDAVAVIDSGYGSDMAEAMLEHIGRVSDAPVRYVINTNSQPHRVLGNAVFEAHGARAIAARDALARLRDDGPAMAAVAARTLGVDDARVVPPGVPGLVVDERLDLDLGGVTLRIVPVGTAHTAGSLVVEAEGDDVVFAGDVLYGGRLLAVLPVGRLDGWVEAYERLRSFDGALFVPGHGQPGPLSAFEHSTRDYLGALLGYMDEAVDEGVPIAEAVDGFDQRSWSDLADFEALARRNAYQAYLEREAASFE